MIAIARSNCTCSLASQICHSTHTTNHIQYHNTCLFFYQKYIPKPKLNSMTVTWWCTQFSDTRFVYLFNTWYTYTDFLNSWHCIKKQILFPETILPFLPLRFRVWVATVFFDKLLSFFFRLPLDLTLTNTYFQKLTLA